MPKESYIQTNFTAGEFSPRMYARVDIAYYRNALKKMQNMYPFPQGGADRRGGTRYINSGKTGTKKVRLVPFEFSTTQAYVLEFGDQYIRFYKNQGVIETGSPLAPVEIASPYLEAELFELQFTQSADILFIAHKNHEPRSLSRTSDVSWTLAVYELIAGPMMAGNTTTTTLSSSATTGNITITASATAGINGGAGFRAADIGRIVSITSSSTTGHAKITAVGSTTSVSATVQTDRPFHDSSAHTDWALGHFYTDNWPACVTFYEQRLVWAGAPQSPQTMAFSVSGDYPNHLADTGDGDAMVYTIATDQVNNILWLDPGTVLAVGTAGGEFVVSAGSDNDALTPTNVRVVRQTTYGSAPIKSIRVSNVVLFVQRAKRKLREFVYRFESDSYNAPDLTLLADHITETGIVDIDYQQEPDSIVWCVLTNGTLVGMTYQRDQQVTGWHRHIIAGVSDDNDTQAEVESLAVIPGTGADGAGRDEVWLSVKRFIDGSTVRHIEALTAGLGPSSDQEDAFYVDSGLTYNSTPTTTITGLDHLEGETVGILADGSVHPSRTVSSGSVTLQREASVVHAGLGYLSRLVTLNIEAGSADGTAQSKTKRITEIAVRVYRSLGFKVGPEGGPFDTVYFRSSADAMDGPPALYTGDKELPFPNGYDKLGIVEIRQDQPLPLTVLGIVTQVKTNG